MELRSTILCALTALLLHAAEDTPIQLLEQARADLNAGRYSQAIDTAQRCAVDFRASSDSKNLAAALRVIGMGRVFSGLYGPAVDSLTEALALARQLHDFGSEIARLNDLGSAYNLQGRYRDALDRYEEALARVREVPNDKWSAWGRQVTTANIAILYQTLGQLDRSLDLYSGLLKSKSDALAPAEQAQLLTNVGVLRRRLGDPVKALETYREAQALYQKAKYPDGQISVLNNIGIVESMDLADAKSAELSFTAAKQLADQTGNRPLAVQAQLNRGEARYRAGQHEKSQADFQAAADAAHQLGLKEMEWKALHGLARNPAMPAGGAHAALLRAVDLIESLRTSAGSTQLRSTFLADKRAVYDLLIETSTTPEDAFRWMEQSRARTLLDQSNQGQPNRDQPNSKTKPLAEFRRDLPPDTVVLEFWMANKAAAVLWITASGAGIRRWTPDWTGLEQVRKVLSDPHRADWREVLKPLARQLLTGIPPLDDPKTRRLRVIPDGPLGLLPFEALPTASGDLLIQKFSISYAPSANLSGHGKASPPKVRWPWDASLAGIADPQPGSGAGEGRVWSPLPHSRTETTTAAGVMGGKTRVLAGADARKAALAGSGSYPILHLATHGQADLQDPERSFLLLAPASATTQQYDYLYSKEVGALSLSHTDLVTLSACETNVGVFVPGEGLRGFSESFLGAGARSVLNSLWTVGDVSTEELMTRFYTNLASGDTAADSLRRAKLDFITNPQSTHPAHWAAFVLAGDGDWRMPRLIGWPWIAGLVVLLVVASMAALRARRQAGLSSAQAD